jgi:flavin-dependent dehydrogenase
MHARDDDRCDILVIGGGPAGSTAAALLAQRGRDVVVLEKDTHPRFHIGESLLPRNLAIFDRLGVRDQIHAMGVVKPGAEIIADATGLGVDFNFASGLDAEFTFAYQVRRDEFDATLFANARRHGARMFEQTRVTEVDFDHGHDDGRSRVVARRADGATVAFSPRFVLDASGRDTFLANRMRLKQSDKRNNTGAIYAHFAGIQHRGDEMAGCISVYLVDDGWFWVIPLPDQITSVGFVGTRDSFRNRTGPARDMLSGRIASTMTLRARMRDAQMVSEVMTAGNYSYRARRGVGENYMLIGDAYGFVDPVFSSGVLLAMTSGSYGAEVAETWLEDQRAGARRAREVERRLRAAMDRLNWLIYRINDPVLRHMLLSPTNRFRMRDGLVSVLAGNIEQSMSTFLPVLAFRTTWRILSLARRAGIGPAMAT